MPGRDDGRDASDGDLGYYTESGDAEGHAHRRRESTETISPRAVPRGMEALLD